MMNDMGYWLSVVGSALFFGGFITNIIFLVTPNNIETIYKLKLRFIEICKTLMLIGIELSIISMWV